MQFSLALFYSLVMFFPGLCALGGYYVGSRSDYLSPAPEKPNSLQSLTIIITGAIFAHLVGSLYFNLQQLWCLTDFCWTVPYEPNPYRLIFAGSPEPSPSGIAATFLIAGILLLGLMTFMTGDRVARTQFIKDLSAPAGSGWLRNYIQAASDKNKVVTGYVISKISNAGQFVAYEGVVLNVAQDDNQGITSIALMAVDRFLVEITTEGFTRTGEESDQIEMMQIRAAEISNIAFEITEILTDQEGNLVT